ncbi:polysaccharide pyruvyl transferase family protein [Enterococcus saccharolyticus]|uniref:Polysaccharide pyruvyl transferase domain-containing protein n=1 Tax=Enterococcus saccharolyticus subsp. saccharolyticus ATCC 43076 TaxID=1139996 RepID=S0JUX5_9ENTE|nr:polysaccharide pyruvyl transferase family protein [Enterococcus saccharolyticus]EOT30781.1 hypothetical protein OMQ_00485 [Enterococcus saccharolyticus subsp. saccharolyticus ATCC 43076]EOT80342.1 hypothetical protein I572_00867 [Enterococcus saccharolyticus subsp. saccharolyticus ATCC 43076]OJG85687.1 hypothetical protein RV16_GL001328 [Enterococcus saccharolyticus]
MIQKIKSRIDFFYRNSVLDRKKETIIKKNIENSKNKKLIIIDIPEHGNIGDHAIAIAQNHFFKKFFSEYDLIEVPAGVSHRMISYIQNLLTSQDILLFHGGGNFGTLYKNHDQLRAEAIHNLKHTKFIQLPQTIYFSNDEQGKNKIEDSKLVYEKQKHKIVFCARETESYARFKNYFPENNSILVPDIVFSMDKLEYNFKRDGIITLLRDDFESAMFEQNNILIECLKKNFKKVNVSDTHLGYGTYIELEDREEIVYDKLQEVAQHEIVITDRLHGMIFAYLTKTPCIAIDNNNHKVRDTYNSWLKDCNYIHFVATITENELLHTVAKLVSLKPNEHSLISEFSPLKNAIK